MTETATDTEKLELTKRLIARLASQCIDYGTLDMVKYLRYKKDIMQVSSIEGLNAIAKSLMEEVCA